MYLSYVLSALLLIVDDYEASVPSNLKLLAGSWFITTVGGSWGNTKFILPPDSVKKSKNSWWDTIPNP